MYNSWDLFIFPSLVIMYTVLIVCKKAELQHSSQRDSETESEVITDEDRHRMEFGELLLMFSEIVLAEFGLDQDRYPVIKRSKKWQCPMVYGVLIGMMNERLKLNVEQYNASKESGGINGKSSPRETSHRPRNKKHKRRENIRKSIFVKGMYLCCDSNTHESTLLLFASQVASIHQGTCSKNFK